MYALMLCYLFITYLPAPFDGRPSVERHNLAAPEKWNIAVIFMWRLHDERIACYDTEIHFRHSRFAPSKSPYEEMCALSQRWICALWSRTVTFRWMILVDDVCSQICELQKCNFAILCHYSHIRNTFIAKYYYLFSRASRLRKIVWMNYNYSAKFHSL